MEGTTGKIACKKDCAGVWGGTAAKDSCGVCTGGTTGKLPCNKIPCETDSMLYVTGAMLKKINPGGNQKTMDSTAKYMNMYMQSYGITNRLRLAYFLANASEETNGFKKLVEDSNFSRNAILNAWSDKIFDSSNVDKYVNCLCVFDHAYAEDGNKILHNNGNEATKDGSKYRGRGLFHLTHRETYYAFTQFYQKKYNDTTVNFENTPNLLQTNYKFAVLSALWVFGVDKSKNKNGSDKPLKRNALLSADKDDIENVTSLINGGDNGLPVRKAKLKLAKQQLCL